jgi:PAS domain S-box-containing protein
VRLAGALLDVTERRRADAELRRHALLFDSLADAVVVVGSDGTILDWNAGAARVFGWSKAEALGHRLGALLLPSAEARLDDAVVACAGDGERRADELTLRGKSGAEIPVELAAVPLLGQEEERVACVAVFRDLGDRRRLMARLQAAERLASLGTLAAGVAHEINNPLAFVLANLDFITQRLSELEGAKGPAQAELSSAIGDCNTGVKRIACIVRDLQVFGGARTDSKETVDPNKALEFALKMAAGKMQRRATVVTDLQSVPPVRATESRLGQVFLNLIVNAAQAIEPGQEVEGTVRVSSRFDAAAGRVLVEVSDNGAGIASGDMDRIFEPFFTTKVPGEGTGLGLFVCQGIVKDLGGELFVESQLGQGSTFRVALPPCGPVPRAEPTRPRLLVVDDEQLIGDALRRCFSGRFEVVAVTSPSRALELVRAGERFTAALIDLHMPGMSGQQLLAQLRTECPELARRTAMLTGGELGQALAGFGGVEPPVILPKPIDLARVAAFIDAANSNVQT